MVAPTAHQNGRKRSAASPKTVKVPQKILRCMAPVYPHTRIEDHGAGLRVPIGIQTVNSPGAKLAGFLSMILRLHSDRYAGLLVRSVEAAEGCGCW
jgi:hypothetical protein